MFITSDNCFLTGTRKIALAIAAIVILSVNTTGQVQDMSNQQTTINADSMQGCTYCLQISGKIVIAKNNNAIAIKIYRYDSLIHRIEASNATGHFSFYLPFDNVYKVVLSKPGYYDKFITVDTKFPKKNVEAKYEVAFTTDMFKTMEGLDVTVLQEPLVEMKYDNAEDIFDFDPLYTQYMIDRIDRLYSDYRLLLIADEESNNTAKKRK